MICKEQSVKWWKIISPTFHKLLHHGDCVELTDNLYAEYPDGRKEIINGELGDYTSWNWKNLPIDQIIIVTNLLTSFDKVGIAKVLNKYKVAPYTICCDMDYVIEQLKIAIRENYI